MYMFEAKIRYRDCTAHIGPFRTKAAAEREMSKAMNDPCYADGIIETCILPIKCTLMEWIRGKSG